MAKRLVVLVGMLMALLVVAVPAFAQEGITPPPGEETVTLSFELIVKGTPPEGTRFFGSAVGEGGPGVPLTDPDGDGIFNGSVTVPKFPPGLRPVPPGTPPIVLPVRIVQVEQGPFGPGELSVIRDFGLIPLDEDKTFSASVSFDGPPPGPAPGTTATFNFELTVKGEPPADARFFGVVPAEGCISAPLTDPDGDGVFTGSVTVPRFPPGPRPVPPGADPVSLSVRIVQENCGNIEVIRDFGLVPLEENRTFEARINFKRDQGGTTTPTPDNGSSDSGGSSGTSKPTSPESGEDVNGDGSIDETDGEVAASVSEAAREAAKEAGERTLPATGGMTPLPLLAASAGLPIAGGLLLRRINRR